MDERLAEFGDSGVECGGFAIVWFFLLDGRLGFLFSCCPLGVELVRSYVLSFCRGVLFIIPAHGLELACAWLSHVLRCGGGGRCRRQAGGELDWADGELDWADGELVWAYICRVGRGSKKDTRKCAFAEGLGFPVSQNTIGLSP